ncbi:MAG: RidA family protein [Pseudomonadota bacterium]
MKSLIPTSLAAPFARYSHGISFDAMSRCVVMTSGQLGMAKDGTIPEDVGEQADICFANIDAILAEEGGTKSDVVRINAYVTDRAHMQGYMAARDRWLTGVDHLPASTLMIVGGFTKPEFKVEIEVMAAVEKLNGLFRLFARNLKS